MHPRLVALVSTIITILSTVPQTARAQQSVGGNIDLQAFRPAMDSRGYITVNASQILSSGDLSIGLVTNWAKNVLNFTAPRGGLDNATFEPGERRYTVENLISPVVQAAVGIFGILELGVTLPLAVVQGDTGPDFVGDTSTPNDNDEFGFDAQGVGDIGLHAKARILNTSIYSLGLAVIGSVYIPARADSEKGKWLGEDKLVFQGTLIVDKEFSRGRFKIAGNGGFKLRTADEGQRTFANLNRPQGMNDPEVPGTGEQIIAPGAEIPFGVGLSYAISRQSIDLIAEVFGSIPLGGENYFPLEAVAGVKLYLARNSFFEFGGGVGLVAGESGGANPDFRVFLGIVFEPNIGDRDGDGIKDDVDACPDDPEDFDDFEDRDGCPDPDNDKDGIEDEDDQCPNEPEDKDGIEDEDGCPESDQLDRDGDGILDDDDACPDDPEDKDEFEDADGCPDLDNDQDGILDVDDLCPNDPEDKDTWEDEDGCPEPDNDKDRILDEDDQCPNEPETYNGRDDEDGCPDKGRVVVTSGSLEILDKIYFETNKAVIKPTSFPILDAIASTLQGNPDILKIEVGGHADRRGPDDYNMKLTQDRADAVRKYLVDKGIKANRLKSVGYGETKPIDKRRNQRAYSKNRRVEFVILQRANEL